MTSIEYSDNPKLRMAQKFVFWTVIVLAGVTVFGMLFGLLIQFLWNATLVPLFEVSSISFWQAVGIFILAKIVFGFGGGTNSSSKTKNSKRQKACTEKVVAEPETVVENSEVSELGADEYFKKFWQEEGRDAYDAFRSRSPD